MKLKGNLCFATLLACASMAGVDSAAQTAADSSAHNVVDEVIWVVGDEPILKSEVEAMRMQAAQEGTRWNGDPDCVIPEQLAVQKLFLHQAAIDSVEVTEADVQGQVDNYVEYWIQQAGSREKLEEYKKQSISQIRNELHDIVHDQMTTQKMREKLVENIKVTPGEVRRYFKDMPQDSIPFVPTEVEVQIITQTPRIEQVHGGVSRKDELRPFTDRINKGETSFSTLARLYSEDPGSARSGGEIDYAGRTTFDPAFANVAFNLTDPKKVSKIVESEFGFHIIQLIDKRGDKIKVRPILLVGVADHEPRQNEEEIAGTPRLYTHGHNQGLVHLRRGRHRHLRRQRHAQQPRADV